MAESLYNVAITKCTADKPVETLVQEALEVLDKTGDPYIEYKLSESLLFGQSGAVLESLPLTESERVQQKLLNIGIETLLQLATDARSETNNGQADEQQDAAEQVGTTVQPDAPSAQSMLQKITARIRKPQRKKHPGTRKALTDSLNKAIAADDNEQYDTDSETTLIPIPAVTSGTTQRPAIMLVSVAAILAMTVVGYFAAGILNKPETASPTTIQPADTAYPPDNNTPAPTTADTTKTAETTATSPKTLALNSTPATPSVRGKTVSRQPAAATPDLPVAELEKLRQMLKAATQQTFGYSENGQYPHSVKKLNRLLELDKPDLALVFAETAADPYEAALLVLNVAHSEQQHKRDTYRDAIMLTMKSLTSRESEPLSPPLMNAALSQTYAMSGDNTAAKNLLNQALQQLSDNNDTTEQISCLSKMIISHQYFSDTATTKKLTRKLAAMAARIPGDAPAAAASISHIYTQLAALALQNRDATAAAGWLKRIPASNARQQLLNHLDTLRTAATAKP